MSVLIYVLENVLRLLHPFMPFITEEIWQNLKDRIAGGYLTTDALIIAPYPEAVENMVDPVAERVMDAVIETVRAIRNVRAERGVAAAKWIEARVYADDIAGDIASKAEIIEMLSRVRPLSVLNRKERAASEENAVVVVLKETNVVLPLSGMVDIAAEKKRLEGEIDNIRGDISRLESRLNDAAFTTKAPAAIVEKERGRLQSQIDKLSRLNQEMGQLT
jgi:valyl-tRNA synthetase